jgi:hypothetical protein
LTRSTDTWQIQNKNSNNVLSQPDKYDPIAIKLLTERFYIESFISREVRIWDCVNKKQVISFSGI